MENFMEGESVRERDGGGAPLAGEVAPQQVGIVPEVGDKKPEVEANELADAVAERLENRGDGLSDAAAATQDAEANGLADAVAERLENRGDGLSDAGAATQDDEANGLADEAAPMQDEKTAESPVELKAENQSKAPLFPVRIAGATKRPKKRRLMPHPDQIRRDIRNMLVDMVNNNQATEKSRIDAAKFLVHMVGSKRRVRLYKKKGA
jgi:hypothetical protein